MLAIHHAKGQRALLTKEMDNGRLAMLAVAYFASAEKLATLLSSTRCVCVCVCAYTH